LGRGALKRALGFGIAAAAVAANLLAQPLLMRLRPAAIIPGLADFEPAWNHGVSFGLLIQNSDTGRYVLMAVLAAISAAVAAMAWRATARLSVIAYGLILGGALGNLIDRVRFEGAVFDFLFLHLGRTPLFVCNLPDIAISAGVVLLFAEALLEARHPKAGSA
jgi:signal peptidase II